MTDKTNTPAPQEAAAHDLRTSSGGRAYVAEYFTTQLRRHDFARYITDTLAADFACVLAQHLSKLRAPVADEPRGGRVDAPTPPASAQPERDWELSCDHCNGSGHVYVKHQVAERKTDVQEFKEDCEECEGRGFTIEFQDIPGIAEYVKSCRPASTVADEGAKGELATSSLPPTYSLQPVATAFFTEKGEVAYTGIYDRTLKALESVKTTRMGISAGSIDLYHRPVSAPAAGDAQALPELNADLISILGRPNFTCIRLAQLLRLSGVDIATKAENEQATVIHYLLGFYLKHGSQWAEKADEDLERRRVAAIAAQQGKGGAA